MKTSMNDDDKATSEEGDYHEALLPHDEVLSSVQEWLQLPLSKDNGDGSSCTLSLDTTGPLTLKDAKKEGDRVAIAILRLDNPKALSSHARKRLEAAVLPYVCRAFGQSIDTVDPQILQEHRDHLTPGDVLFCAVQVQLKTVAPGKGPKRSHCRPHFVAHLLLSVLGGIHHMNNNNDNVHRKKAVCIVGRVCDPSVQNRGVSAHIQSVAFRLLQPNIIVTRTANPSILRLLQKAALELSSGNTNAIKNDANHHDNTAKYKIFPDDCHSPSDWQLARYLADQIMTKWEHLHPDKDKYDEQFLVFRNLYSTVNQQVFGGGQQLASSPSPLEFVNAGDAVLRLLVFLDTEESSSSHDNDS